MNLCLDCDLVDIPLGPESGKNLVIDIIMVELYVLTVLKNNGMSNILMTIVRALVKEKYNLVYNYTIKIIEKHNIVCLYN